MARPLAEAASRIFCVALGRWFVERTRNNLRFYRDETDLAELSSFIAGPLYFRRPIAADAEIVHEVLSDPVTIEAQGLTGPPGESVQQLRKRFTPDRFDVMVGVERVSEQPVGWTELGPSPWGSEGSQLIGLLLHSRHRGSDFGRHLLFAAISLARERYRQHRFEGELHVAAAMQDLALQHTMKELGYEPDLGIYDYNAPNGEVFKTLLFQCDLSEPWPQIEGDGF